MGEIIPGFERHKAIQKIATVGLEGDALSPLFCYAKIKWNVLFFVFKHPGAKREFEYRKEQIREKMKGYYRLNSKELRALDVVFTDFKAMVILEHKAPEPVKKTPMIYAERSTGDFDISCTDPKLRELFTRIQQTIKAERGK